MMILGIGLLCLGFWLCWTGFDLLETKRNALGVVALVGMVVVVILGMRLAFYLPYMSAP